MEITISQIEGTDCSKVGTKVSILKPKIWGWLFTTSYFLATKTRHDKESMERYNNIRAFELEFKRKLWLITSKHHYSRSLKKTQQWK